MNILYYIEHLIEQIKGNTLSVFAYGRVSTKDQTTENQRQEIERAGYQVEYWFADEGVSGKVHASQRPQFKALLAYVDARIAGNAGAIRAAEDAIDRAYLRTDTRKHNAPWRVPRLSSL